MEKLRLNGINHIAIKCRDLATSKKFYKDILGAKCFGQTDSMVFLMLGDTDLTLELNKDFNSSKGFVSHLGFSVNQQSEVDFAADLLKKNNIDIDSGPENRGDARFIYFRDPDGNPFELFYSFKSSNPDRTQNLTRQQLQGIKGEIPLRFFSL